jgi:predicted pyridoxine 5'-phosphate oxidase superfamily flavin-nucleotide-binding protein
MLTDEIRNAFAQRDPIAVLTTVDNDGMPNSIYLSCYGLMDDRILICDSAFSKTLNNLKANPSKAVFLFWAPELAAYQLKGNLSYHEEGKTFDEGLRFAKDDMEPKGIAVFETQGAYKGALKLV